MSPQIGDIWKELHPDHPRFVCVASVGDDEVRIYRVEKDPAGHWHRPKHAPARRAARIRFDGRRYGYGLVERAR